MPTGPSASVASGPLRGSASPTSCGDRRSCSIAHGRTRTTGATTSPRTCAWPDSFVMPVTPAAVELLEALSQVLARWGRWYVFGAQAVIAYGVPRLSADVDVTLQLVPDEPERFVREMADAGFALRVDDPDFVRRTRVMPFVHLATA